MLSVCMIVKNEERNLQACLDSVREIASEIVIVDTGSTDRTPQIAASNGARVLQFDFTFVDFAAARNRGIDAAEGDWIFVIDADERLDPASLPLIRKLVALGEDAGYYAVRRNRRAGGRDLPDDYVARLFPNLDAYRFCGRVHETIDRAILEGGGRLRRSGILIDHDFAPDPEQRRRKNLQYAAILREELAANPLDASRLRFLAADSRQLAALAEG